jgi:hypothetical protein
LTRAPYLIGYARVSKGDEQSNAAQRRALDAAGCRRVFEETASGGRWDRPKLLEMIGQLRDSDVVVWNSTGYRAASRICCTSWSGSRRLARASAR